MRKIKKVDQEVLKTLNRQIILNCIRQHKEISRIDLAQQTKLSPTTVSAITSELVEKNMINELRIGESSGGRRPVIFGINPEAKFVISVVLTAKEVVCALIDLEYNIVKKKYLTYKPQSAQEVLDNLIKCISHILDQFEKDKEQICGIGISLPGVVDYKTGNVLYSSKLFLKDFNIVEKIYEHVGIKSFVYKDTDALILGENNFGLGNMYKNFVYIIIENGVGMSYINGGKLFTAGYGGGFELGHTTVDLNGPQCTCGNKGCLATLVSERPAVNKLRKFMDIGLETSIQDTTRIHLEDIVQYSNEGDKVSRYVLEEQAGLLGMAIGNVINLFNPELVVLGGPLVKCEWDFLDRIKNTVQDRALSIYSKNVEIKFTKLGNESALIGMADEIYKKEVFRPVQL